MTFLLYIWLLLFFIFRGHAVYRLHVEFRRIKNSHSEGKQLLATNYWYVHCTIKQTTIRNVSFNFVCLFVWGQPPSRWFFTHMETSNFDLYLAFMAMEQWGFYIDKLWHCDKCYPIRMVISEDRDTHTCCLAFGSGAVTTCFYDLGLSRLGFEHLTFYIRGEHSNWLRHRGGVSFEDAQECNCKNMTTPMFFLNMPITHYKQAVLMHAWMF